MKHGVIPRIGGGPLWTGACGSPRVGGGPPLALPHLLHRRAQRRLAQRQQQQYVDQKEPKLFRHQTSKRAAAREVPLSPSRAFHHFRDQQVDDDQHAEVGKELEHETGQVSPTFRPRHPLIPLEIHLRVQRLGGVVDEREEREWTRDEHQPQEQRTVHRP